MFIIQKIFVFLRPQKGKLFALKFLSVFFIFMMDVFCINRCLLGNSKYFITSPPSIY